MANKRPPISGGSWVVLGVLGAMLAAFLVLAFAPYWRTTSRLRAQIESSRNDMARIAEKSEQLRDLSARSTAITREVRDYPRLVPDTKDLGQFLGQLSRALDAAGMRDTAVHQLPPTLLGKSTQVPIEVHGTGSYEQFHGFLEALEKLPRMSSISRLEVKADDAMSGKVTIELTLSIYSTHEN